MDRIVVVGASLAGIQAAQAMRRQDYEGELVLVGDEPHYPYDRPPLSKGYLAGTVDDDRLRLRQAVDPAEYGIDWRLGRRAVSFEPPDPDGERGRVGLDDGSSIEFDGAVICTGARPRNLPVDGEPDGLFTLRTVDDSQALRAALAKGPDRLVVVGCGFIGAEVAATAREQGIEVTIVEAAPAPLARVLDAEAGLAVAELHRSHGVDVRLGTGVAEVATRNGSVAGLVLDDGSAVEAAVVVVGIGVTPNTEWLDGSGLTIDNGVVADETCLAAPGVVVAGDVARWPNRRFGGDLLRVEQWDNAVGMGTYAGKRLLAWAAGEDIEPFAPVPWFWSDQYDRKIQLAGVPGPETEVVQGSHAEHRFVQLYGDGEGGLVGSLCWNRPRQAVMGRQLIETGATLDDARAQLS